MALAGSESNLKSASGSLRVAQAQAASASEASSATGTGTSSCHEAAKAMSHTLAHKS